MNQVEWMHLTSQLLILFGTFFLYLSGCHIARVWSEMRAELVALRGEPVAASIEPTADDTPHQVLAELRELIAEIRADRHERAQAMRRGGYPFCTTGADAHGLPG